MTTLWLLLSLVAAIAVGFGIVLRRLHRTPVGTLFPDFEDDVDNGVLSPGRFSPETYRPMSRLFAGEDFTFLAGSAPQMVPRLRRCRRRVLRLYLRELRADFARVYAICRMLAPTSSDPHFATRITQQALSFYGLLLIVEMRCALGWFLPVRVDTAELVNAFDVLRQAAQASLAPQPVPAG